MQKHRTDALHRKRIDEVFNATMLLIDKYEKQPTPGDLARLVQVSGTINGLIKAAATIAAREPALADAPHFILSDVYASFRQFLDAEMETLSENHGRGASSENP